MCDQLFTLFLLALSLTLVTPDVAAETLTESLARVAQSIKERQDHLETLLNTLEEAAKNASQPKETIYTVFTDLKKNWYEAFADCRKRGMDLASVENEVEFQQVLSKLKEYAGIYTYKVFWLAGSDIGSEGNYVWMNTGQPMTYTAWYSSGDVQEPSHDVFDGEKEHCLSIRNIYDFRWNDEVCSKKNYYICVNKQ